MLSAVVEPKPLVPVVAPEMCGRAVPCKSCSPTMLQSWAHVFAVEEASGMESGAGDKGGGVLAFHFGHR